MLLKRNMENIVVNLSLSINKVQNNLWQMLLFLMIFIPRTGQILKLIILILLFGLSLLEILRTKKIKISKEVNIYLILHLTYVLLSGFYGVSLGNPGALDFLRVNLIYYLVLIISLSSFFSEVIFQKSIKTIIHSANLVSIYSFLLLLVDLKIWPERYFITFDVTSNVGIHSGYTHLTNTNLSMMIFILPFLLTLFFNNYKFTKIRRSQVLLSIIMGIISTLISGRRILWLSFIIPIFYYTIKFEKRNLKAKFKIVAVFIGISSIIFFVLSISSIFSLEMIVDRFLNAFNSDVENIRFIQARALWHGFLENPLLGSGAGMGVDEVVRSFSAPWSYEMTYNLILFNSGIIGFIIFISSHLYLLSRFYVLKKRHSAMGESLFVTYVVVLIASGTNPYFTSSFDFIWFVIFPLMYFYTADFKIKRDSYPFYIK